MMDMENLYGAVHIALSHLEKDEDASGEEDYLEDAVRIWNTDSEKINKRKRRAARILAHPTKIAVICPNTLIIAGGHLKNAIKW